MTENEIPNRLGNMDSTNSARVAIAIEMFGGLEAWAELVMAVRAAGIDFSVQRISGNQIIVDVPTSQRQTLINIINSHQSSVVSYQ